MRAAPDPRPPPPGRFPGGARELADLAWITGLVVLLFFGPQLADLFNRSRLVRGPERPWEPSAAWPESGDVVRVSGSLDLDSAHVCPPGWLRLGEVPNEVTVTFAPLFAPDDASAPGRRLLAWVRIPSDGPTVLPGLADGATVAARARLRVGLQWAPPLDDADLPLAMAQLKLCPVPGQPGPIGRAGEPVLLAELLSLRGDPSGPLVKRSMLLMRRMLTAWALAFAVLCGMRLATRRRGRRRRSRPWWPARSTLQLLLAQPGRAAGRLVLSAVLVGGVMGLTHDLPAAWVRFSAIDASTTSDTPPDGTIRYERAAGLALLGDALLCDPPSPEGGLRWAPPSALVPFEDVFDRARRYLVLTLRGIREDAPRSVVFPVGAGADLVARALRRHEVMTVHAYGYSAPSADGGGGVAARCRSLDPDAAGGGPADGATRAIPAGALVVDARPPVVYGARILGVALLAALLAAALALLWSLLAAATARRRAGPTIDR